MPNGNSAISIQPNSTRGIIPGLEQEVVSVVNQGGCHGAVMRKSFGRHLDEVVTSFRECWRRMRVMHAEFERSGERGEERLRDEEAWSRMDDEGCPNGAQHPYPRQDIIREESDAGPNVPAYHL